MLTISHPGDKGKMMMYHRTRDMLNLITYFPDLSPVRNLTIIDSIEDYEKNYEFCKTLSSERNDTLITKPFMPSVEGTGINPDIPSIFKKVKELDPDGVMVLFNLCHEPSERYERYAGLSVGVSLGKGVYIDAVGKGFDGREVSKGICTHERYFIPWFELRKCSVGNFKNYRFYLISDKEYKKTRIDRISFLTSIGLEKKLVEQEVPLHYQEIPDFIWEDIIKNVIKKVVNMEEELEMVGLNEFAFSGHTEGKRFLPWQMFDKSRYTSALK